ncbi:TetR/AcrR family transcriptional regulator [Streptomyces sp. NPDC058385]|uniref:TetR/AcrR family transcriptional regulator n=1 Tax=Streptomyces sp. NPDC058385 TaxID=3346473 RepID=UPI00364F1382
MPRQVDHAARLAAVEDAVVAIAAETGFDAVTIRAVASRVGASTSVVTHYVGSREELLRNAVRRELDCRRAEADSKADGLHGSAALRAVVEWAILSPTERSHRFWLALVLSASNQPTLRGELSRFNEWWFQRIEQFLREAGSANPTRAADLVSLFVDGIVVSGFDAGEPWTLDRRTRLLNDVWEALSL